MKRLYINATIISLVILFYVFDQYKKKQNHIIEVAGIETSCTPCMEAIESLFGKNVNSQKACECILPLYYNSIKEDSAKLNEFKQSGVLPVDSNSVVNRNSDTYTHCIIENVIDSNAKINFSNSTKLMFKKKLQHNINFEAYMDSNLANNIYDCVVEKISNLTIKQYITGADSQIIQKMLDQCTYQRK